MQPPELKDKVTTVKVKSQDTPKAPLKTEPKEQKTIAKPKAEASKGATPADPAAKKVKQAKKADEQTAKSGQKPKTAQGQDKPQQ